MSERKLRDIEIYRLIHPAPDPYKMRTEKIDDETAHEQLVRLAKESCTKHAEDTSSPWHEAYTKPESAYFKMCKILFETEL